MISTIISYGIFVGWTLLVVRGLYVGSRRKNKQSIIPLSIATFFLACLWLLTVYDKFSNHRIGKMDDCGLLGVIPFIITLICTIFGLVALVRNEDEHTEET
jgi:surface polysaccharide O-acyltransferase-like enzyme